MSANLDPATLRALIEKWRRLAQSHEDKRHVRDDPYDDIGYEQTIKAKVLRECADALAEAAPPRPVEPQCANCGHSWNHHSFSGVCRYADMAGDECGCHNFVATPPPPPPEAQPNPDPATLRAHVERLRLFLGYGSNIDEELDAAVRAGLNALSALAEAAPPRPVEQEPLHCLCPAFQRAEAEIARLRAERDAVWQQAIACELCAEGECDYHSGVRKPPTPPEKSNV
jgi:hypothetical protein